MGGDAAVDGGPKEDPTGDPPPPPPPGRMGACEVCEEAPPAKYRCPACSVATCSLACSRSHKTRGGGCTGKRDRAAFKPITEFTDRDVINDYRFLEEALLEKDRAKRWKPGYTAGTEAAQRSERPPATAKIVGTLTREAKTRGVELFCMPDGMARRVANTTFFDRKRNVMQWRVEWTFHASREIVNADDDVDTAGDEKTIERSSSVSLRAEDPKLDESTTLLDALRVHLAPGPGRAARLHQLRRFADAMKGATGMNAGEDAGQSAKTPELAVYLEKEGCPANDKRYHRLDVRKTLRECLEGKRVLEFPSMQVTVLPEDEGRFREPDQCDT